MRRNFFQLIAGMALGLAAAAPVSAEVTRLEITSKEPYGTFRPGDYVLWKGRLHGELSPGEAIADIDRAKRNDRGKVEYAADLMLLMPDDPARGNGALLVDVPNRGRAYGVALYNSPPEEPFEAGNLGRGTGFLQDQGYTLAEVSWELGRGADLPSYVDAAGKTLYVEGAGFAIVRDAADFLAHGWADASGTANPLRGAISRVLASGKSQSGRFLKTYLLEGFNRLQGRRVIDGMHVFVSGAGLLPILRSSPGPDSGGSGAPSFVNPEFRGVHEGPFTIGEILAKLAARGEMPPRIVMISSTTDFLSLRASLGRTGADGTTDQALPANVRMYDIAGASHAVLPNADCKLPRERLDWSPVSRATLYHLDRWVTSNVQPPANRLMPLEPAGRDPDVLAAPAHLAGSTILRPRRDGDGNALGGVRLPDVAVPLGVHAAQQDPKSFACALAGAFLPFTAAKLGERYAGRDDYVNRIRVAARALEAEGFLLPDDVAVIIAAAAATRAFKQGPQP